MKSYASTSRREETQVNNEQNQHSLRMAGENILKTTVFSKQTSLHFTERTLINDHQTQHQQFGYNVSNEINQHEYSNKGRGSSLSTDHHLSNTDNQTSTRGPSTDCQEQFSNSRQQNQNIRKTFHFDENEIFQQLMSDSSPSQGLVKEQQRIFLSNSIITTSTKEIKEIPKFRQIRKCFAIIQALIRMKTLCMQKQASWKQQIDIVMKNQQVLKYNNSITIIRIKQWTQMIFSKMISIIKLKELSQQNLNFILLENQLEKDQAIITIANIFTYTMSNLIIMTKSQNLLHELCLMMYQEQYCDYRNQFSKFVSERVYYISQDHPEIASQEKALILAEFIIINQIIPSLVKLTHSIDCLKCDKQSIEFLIRCIISLLHYFFIKNFQDMPKISLKKQFKYQQYQLGKKENSFILLKNEANDQDELIIGMFKEHELSPLLKKENWYQGNMKKLQQAVENLQNHY